MTGNHGSLRERFWRYVTPTDGCWLWVGNRNEDGYGTIRGDAGRVMKAHRASWMLHIGTIAPGLEVRHRCDTPACVRPDHLEIGTHRDNMRDAQERGRLLNGPRGEQHYRARLTAPRVVAMRGLAAAGATKADLAREFDVAPVTVWRVLTRQSWRHVAPNAETGAPEGAPAVQATSAIDYRAQSPDKSHDRLPFTGGK